MISAQEYLSSVDVPVLLSDLAPESASPLLRQVQHFTLNEAEHRDEMVLGYFGKEGLESLVRAMASRAAAASSSESPAVLDVGAGTGTFTIPIVSRVKHAFPGAKFYAVDLTPAMLSALASKSNEILPFVGVAENLLGSVRMARRHLEIPDRFDVIMSTLALHHCPEIGRVFESMDSVLTESGKVVLADLCKHPFEEFRQEMGDYHLGFEPAAVKSVAERFFGSVDISIVEGLSCSSSGRSAQIFILTARR